MIAHEINILESMTDINKWGKGPLFFTEFQLINAL